MENTYGEMEKSSVNSEYTADMKIRYARLAAVCAIGDEGVSRLRNGSVLVVGCGALGSLCAMYLAASGVGRLGIADFDTIDISNLQRQLFFAESHVGLSKAETLADRIRALNSGVCVETHRCLVTKKMAPGLFARYDFVVDATDNPSSKFMTDEVCRQLGKPCCIGGVREGTGQVFSWRPGSVAYSDIFSPPECSAGFTPCSIGGVLGPAAGVVASVQASEAIKHLTGAGRMLYDSLYVIDLLDMTSQVLPLK